MHGMHFLLAACTSNENACDKGILLKFSLFRGKRASQPPPGPFRARHSHFGKGVGACACEPDVSDNDFLAFKFRPVPAAACHLALSVNRPFAEAVCAFHVQGGNMHGPDSFATFV